MAEQESGTPPSGDHDNGSEMSGGWWTRIMGALGGFGKAIWYGREGVPDESVLSTGDEPPPLDYGAFDRQYRVFTKWLSYLAAVSLGIITLVCFIDVVTWKFFGWTLPSATDLVTYLNLVIVFLAAAYVQMDRGSVAIELLQSKFSRVMKLLVRILASVLGVGVCLFAAYRSWYQLADLYTRHAMADGVWHFLLWPFQAVLVLGFVCMGVAFFLTVFRDITNYRRRRAQFAPKADDLAPHDLTVDH